MGQDRLLSCSIMQSMANEERDLPSEVRAGLPPGCGLQILTASLWDSVSELPGVDGIIKVEFRCSQCQYNGLGVILLWGEPTWTACWFFPVDIGGLYTVEDRTRTHLRGPAALCIKKQTEDVSD